MTSFGAWASAQARRLSPHRRRSMPRSCWTSRRLWRSPSCGRWLTSREGTDALLGAWTWRSSSWPFAGRRRGSDSRPPSWSFRSRSDSAWRRASPSSRRARSALGSIRAARSTERRDAAPTGDRRRRRHRPGGSDDGRALPLAPAARSRDRRRGRPPMDRVRRRPSILPDAAPCLLDGLEAAPCRRFDRDLGEPRRRPDRLRRADLASVGPPELARSRPNRAGRPAHSSARTGLARCRSAWRSSGRARP